jgi:hypothetical protein
LGKNSATYWSIVYFGNFFITEVAHILGAAFFHEISYALILAKEGWATFWAIFFQSHLVNLTIFFTCQLVLGE